MPGRVGLARLNCTSNNLLTQSASIKQSYVVIYNIMCINLCKMSICTNITSIQEHIANFGVSFHFLSVLITESKIPINSPNSKNISFYFIFNSMCHEIWLAGSRALTYGTGIGQPTLRDTIFQPTFNLSICIS